MFGKGVRTADFLFLVVAIFYAGEEESGFVREDEAALFEVLVPRVQHRVQHAFVEEEVAHPFGDDDVDLREWKFYFLHLSLQ